MYFRTLTSLVNSDHYARLSIKSVSLDDLDNGVIGQTYWGICGDDVDSYCCLITFDSAADAEEAMNRISSALGTSELVDVRDLACDLGTDIWMEAWSSENSEQDDDD